MCVCHLWLLVVTRLSICPLGSSLSLVISLSWRALRLLSRAASSSSSSFFANLRETKEKKRERVRKQKETSPFLLPQFRNFKGNNPLNWAVISTVTKPGGFGGVVFFLLFSPIKLTCQLCSNQYFLSRLQFS